MRVHRSRSSWDPLPARCQGPLESAQGRRTRLPDSGTRRLLLTRPAGPGDHHVLLFSSPGRARFHPADSSGHQIPDVLNLNLDTKTSSSAPPFTTSGATPNSPEVAASGCDIRTRCGVVALNDQRARSQWPLHREVVDVLPRAPAKSYFSRSAGV